MKDCYDCEYAEFDVEEYYGGGKQKIVTGCKSKDFCSEQVSVGDWLKCNSKYDMVDTMMRLADEDIETEYRFERNGMHGYWLEVIAIE